MTHFTQNNFVLSLLVAFDGVTFQNAFVDFESDDAVLVKVHVGDFHKDKAFVAIVLLNFGDAVVKSVAVQNFAALDD